MRLDDFLACFFPEPEEPFFIRGFSPKEIPDSMKSPVFGREYTRAGLNADVQAQNHLKALNAMQGLYFVPNSGGFKEHEITRFNAVFCEIDNLPIEEQHDLYDNAPLPPSLRVETKKSVHAYWLFEKQDVTREQWFRAQCGLIEFFKSDAGIKNPNRVMRLPFFNHLTYTEEGFITKRVRIHTFFPETRFSISELHRDYPFVVSTAPVVTNGNGLAPTTNGNGYENTIEGVAAELRYRISQHPTYKVEPDHVHATCQGICHGAQHGKTAIMVNIRTGAVFCHAGCDYWRIAESFGLSKPAASDNRYQNRVVGRAQKNSNIGKRLLTRFYGEQH